MRPLFLVCLLALGCAAPAYAWSDHAHATLLALRAAPEIAPAARVGVETLDDFLRAEEPRIAALLSQDEAGAAAHFPGYPARPAALAFTAAPDRSDAER